MASVVERAIFKKMGTGNRSLHGIARHGLVVAASTVPRAIRTCVVFVHGLNGNVVSTWLEFPRLLAADRELDDVDMAFFGYKTTIFDGWGILRGLGRWLPVARPYNFEAKAQELADELRWLRRTQHSARIVLASHSLGGLIVLEALRQLL